MSGAGLGPGPLVLGLTGGIGSGKSTVARAFVARGAALVDTDAIAHALTAPGGAAMPRLRETFGDAVAGADGALDRAAMRALVFADAAARQRLESILHPMIGAEALRRCDAALAGGHRVRLLDVPLLAESLARSAHWRERCERIVVVDCDADTQVARVVARSGWSPAQVRTVIDQQASRERRRAIADAVIVNDAARTLDALDADVVRLWQRWGLDG